MAVRRMFSMNIIGKASFLKLPQTSRLLYYDLGMYADDDGVVEAFKVMQMTGAAEDDLQCLIAKGFLRPLINDEQVMLITDWQENNQIRKDRYRRSIYHDLVVQDELNNIVGIKEHNVYMDANRSAQ